jgi:endonuclease YncB( thermonuclease family)
VTGKIFIICLIAFLNLNSCWNTATSKPSEPIAVSSPSPIEKIERNEDGFSAKVKFLSDGDSFVVYQGEETLKVRIYGIDAPESHQELGKESRENLKKIIGRSEVFLIPKARDKFGRMIARVLVNEKDVGEMQILDGFAWAYRPEWNDLDYESAENEARANQKGLWSLSNPEEPWEWRKNHPRTN